VSATAIISVTDVAKGLTIFEIDESLAALVEAAEEDAEGNNGEFSEPIKTALAIYAAAFGCKSGSDRRLPKSAEGGGGDRTA
jgi:hypothetical protein